MSPQAVFSFPVSSFRHIETPFQGKGYKDYFAVVETSQLPNLSEWREINVRAPKLTGAVPNAIRESYQNNPEMFVFMNRGLVISVENVKYDNRAGTVTITLTNKHLHGLLDGGHTYNIVQEELEGGQQEPQFIRVEFLEGFGPEGILDIVDARNTSNQVKEQSLMNLAKDFDPLKKALRNTIFEKKISYSEFDVDENNEPKPIDIREVVAILTLFDHDNFSDTDHPIMAYNSKAACLKHFQDKPESYKKMLSLAPDMLRLYDYVKLNLPELYNKVRGGKFGRLKGVKVYEGRRSTPLHYIGKSSKYAVPDGFTYPVLGAFRGLLEEKNGQYVWGKGLDPIALLEGDLGQKLANTIGTFALEIQNPSKVGKTAIVWQSCYQSAQLMYLQS
ncbi:MAG: AIPR family protein [Anaerolineales bacterium]|nr:AIPR family protein [Anaerolineales bacterium]